MPNPVPNPRVMLQLQDYLTPREIILFSLQGAGEATM
jgi:hypothetical protein